MLSLKILHIIMTSKGVICSYFAKYFNCCICQYKHHIRCATTCGILAMIAGTYTLGFEIRFLTVTIEM